MDLAHLLEEELREAGYRVTVAGSVVQGLIRAREERPDLILTDLTLPDGQGASIIRRVRTDSAVPIMVLTARDDVTEKVTLLGLGADDYLVKPVAVGELLARIAVQLRSSALSSLLLSAGQLEIRPQQRLALLHGQEVHLAPKELDLLILLLQQPGRVYSRAEISQAIWKGRIPAHSNIVDVHFANIRAKFRAHNVYGLLRTVRGVGYALTGGRG